MSNEAYGRLFARARFYRRWPARAMFFVPFVAVIVALVASVVSHCVNTSTRAARHDFIAEHGPDVAPPSTPLADLAPGAPQAFLVALFIAGLLGLAVYLGVAMVLRQRVQREAERLAEGAAGPSGAVSP